MIKFSWVSKVVLWMSVSLSFSALAEDSPLSSSPAPDEAHASEISPPSSPLPLASPSPKRDPRVPLFYDLKPQWGLELGFTPNAFGGTALTKAQGSLPAFGFAIITEFQPRFLQFFGVIGLGTTVSIYPILGGNNLTPSFASLWSVGGQVRYQAKYFRQQILVPTVSYTYEYFQYQFSAGPSGNLQAKGLVYGLWLLLNQLDRSIAADFYIDAGVARSYLIFEMNNVSGLDGALSFGSPSYYGGLRFEF